MSKTTTKPKAPYRVLNGLNYNGKRAEPGSVRADIPAASVPWLIKLGAIEPIGEKDGD